MSIIRLLASKNYITVNKDLIKKIGLKEAVLLGELASEYSYWEIQDKLEDGYFYSTVDNIEENTTLSEYEQRKVMNKLKDMGIIEIKVKGLPAKRYIRIIEEQLLEILSINTLKNSVSSSLKTQELLPEKLKGNNNNINKNKEIRINNNIYMSEGVEKAEPVKDYEEKFNIFYKAYPKKVAKTKVLSWFKSNKPKDDLFELMMKKLEIFKKSYNWNKDNGQYIPNPTTWLNQKRWEDEIEITTNLGGTQIKTEGQQLLEMIKGGVFDE